MQANPIEHYVAGQDPQQADGQRNPPPDDTLVAQHGRRDDRHFLRDWHSQAAEQEHGEHADVREAVDELLERLHRILARRTLLRLPRAV